MAGRFGEPIEMWSGVMQAARSTEYMSGEPGRNGYVIESAPGHPGLIALGFSWEGADAHAGLMERIGSFAPLIAITRDGGEGRVGLSRSGSVRVDYRLDATGVATLRHALVRMARIARAAGAREVVAMGTPPAWHGRQAFGPGGEERAFAAFEERLGSFDFAPNRGSVFSAHQMGTVRMGADPRGHACDPAGRVRTGSSDQVVARPVRGRFVALSDGARGQSDADRDGPRPARRADGRRRGHGLRPGPRPRRSRALPPPGHGPGCSPAVRCRDRGDPGR